MPLYSLVLVLKFLGVMAYAGGLTASITAESMRTRKLAAHGVASPGLLVTWLAGYVLIALTDIPLSELWVAGGLVLSLASQLALVRFAAHGRRSPAALALLLVPLVAAVVLMVLKPTWQGALK